MQKGSFNRVILVGHLGDDPKSRYFSSGTAVANFSIATNESYKDKEDKLKDHTEWHRCVLMGKLAESGTKILKKGQLIYFEGRMRTRSWTDKDGVKRTTTEVLGDNFTLLGKRPEGAEAPAESGGNGGDDDIPF